MKSTVNVVGREVERKLKYGKVEKFSINHKWNIFDLFLSESL